MLNNSPVTPILPVADLGRARKFYEDKLGLIPSADVFGGKILYDCGYGTSLFLYEKGAPSAAEHTAVTFAVESIDDAVNLLKDKGVSFEEYDYPGLKTVNGIAELEGEKAAWFKDPDNNILCLHESVWTSKLFKKQSDFVKT